VTEVKVNLSNNEMINVSRMVYRVAGNNVYLNSSNDFVSNASDNIVWAKGDGREPLSFYNLTLKNNTNVFSISFDVNADMTFYSGGSYMKLASIPQPPSGYDGIGKAINASFNLTMNISFYYKDSELPANVMEDSLSIWRYNGSWNKDGISNEALDTTNNIVSAVVSKYSIFAPLGVVDINPPKFSNEINSPTSPTTYSPTQTYTFNITVTDDTNISTVIFNFNNANYTPTCSPSLQTNETNCTYTFTSLPAGGYTYFWWANDTFNNANQTQTKTYTINKASPTLYLNGTDSDRTYHIYQTSNITAQINVSGKQICLYSNLTGFSTICNTTMITSLQHLKQVGTFYTTANFKGNTID